MPAIIEAWFSSSEKMMQPGRILAIVASVAMIGMVSTTAFRAVLAAQHALRARSKPGSKLALKHLLRRSSWSQLPAGEPRLRREA